MPKIPAPRYWRVTFLAANGKRRHVWAKNYIDPGAGGNVKFFVVDKNGDEDDPRELVIAAPADIVRLRPCVWNLHTAELEVAHA